MPVTLDFSKAQPIPPVTLDFSKAQPIDSQPTDTRNAFQRGVDGLINYVEHPEQRGEQAPGPLTKFAGGILRGSAGVVAHPLDALQGMKQAATPDSGAKGVLENFAPGGVVGYHTIQGLIHDPAATAGQLVGGTALGEAVGPVVGPLAEAVKRGASKAVLLGKTPEGAYESALKPSTTLPQADRTAIVQTGLQQGIPVSKAGFEKLGDLIDDYNQKIKDVVAQDPTRPIDPTKVATRSADARARFAKQVNKTADLNAIEASKQQFLDEQGQKPGVPAQPTGLLDAQGNPIMRAAQPPTPAPPMNAIDAQEMKQGTYKVLKGKFGEQGSAAVEAQKSLARGLKEEIAAQFPELDGLNAAESKLLDLQPVLERAINRNGNHQVIGIGTPVAGAAAKAVTGSNIVANVAMVLKGVLDNPNVKSRLAIAVSKGAKVPYSQALSRVQAYSASLGSAVGGSQAYSSGDSPNQPATPQP